VTSRSVRVGGIAALGLAVTAFTGALASGEVLASTLDNLYNPDSSSYQHWLAAGQFDASYAPATATQNAVAGA
jgi:hypothetical protein